MTVVVVPPQGDVTLVLEPEPGASVLDLGRALAAEAVDPGLLRSRAVELERLVAGGEPGAVERLLFARAAEQLRARPQSVHRILRVAAAAYRSMAGTEAPVRLVLDDIELREGTTERSSCLTWAIGEEALYTHVLRRALELPGGEEVVLVVDRDQQLPAALWIAARLDRHRVRLAGEYAGRHWPALSTLPALDGTRLLGRAPPGTWRVAGLEPGVRPQISWRERAGEPLPSAPWAGRVALADLIRPERLIDSGCEAAIAGICSLDASTCLGEEGEAVARSDLQRGVNALREAGTWIVAEWWIGAPGVDRKQLESTFEELATDGWFDWVAGLRAFRWEIDREPRWDGREVELGSPPPDHDLARSRPFSAPGTIPPGQVREEIETLALRLLERAPLAPGRVAAALCSPPDPPIPVDGALDPDCVIVHLPARLDGEAEPTAYAANLRTGALMRLDQRIAAVLDGPAAGVARLPERIRAGLEARSVLAPQSPQ